MRPKIFGYFKTTFNAVMPKHAAVCRFDQVKLYLSRLDIDLQCKPGKRPRDVFRCDRTIRRYVDQKSPDRTVDIYVTD